MSKNDSERLSASTLHVELKPSDSTNLSRRKSGSIVLRIKSDYLEAQIEEEKLYQLLSKSQGQSLVKTLSESIRRVVDYVSVSERTARIVQIQCGVSSREQR